MSTTATYLLCTNNKTNNTYERWKKLQKRLRMPLLKSCIGIEKRELIEWYYAQCRDYNYCLNRYLHK